MSVKMYAGIRLDTGSVQTLVFVDGEGRLQGVNLSDLRRDEVA